MPLCALISEPARPSPSAWAEAVACAASKGSAVLPGGGGSLSSGRPAPGTVQWVDLSTSQYATDVR